MSNSEFHPLRPKAPSLLRTVAALILREVSTTYGRSSLGYLWAILEPAAGILLLTLVFSLALQSPPLGTNFALFYASGMLPFLAYLDISQKVAQSLRFSRQLLMYPSISFIEAILARLVLNFFTQALVGFIVISAILVIYDVAINADVWALFSCYAMILVLAAGIGTLNCYLLMAFPNWERTWAILNRPLFIVSCIFFLFETVPISFQTYLWWNPLIHIIGEMRAALYMQYEANYVSHIYVSLIGVTAMMFGLVLLRRYHSDLLNN